MPKISAEQFVRAKELIDNASCVLVAGHRDPDGDSVSSALAFASYLKSVGKEYAVYMYDRPPHYLHFLPLFDEIRTSLPQKNFDLVIAVDYGNFWRLQIDGFVPRDAKILTADHHELADQKGDVMLVDERADSTCRIIHSFFAENGIAISNDIAMCLFCGIVTDTGVFQFENTTVETLENALSLIQHHDFDWKGVIREAVYCERDTATFKLWSRVLGRLEKDRTGTMAYTNVTRQDFKDFRLAFEKTGGLIDLLKTVSDAKFTMFLKDIGGDGTIEASLRSDSQKGFDVAELAILMGGGGHKMSAGFRMKGTIEEVVFAVENKIKELRKKKK